MSVIIVRAAHGRLVELLEALLPLMMACDSRSICGSLPEVSSAPLNLWRRPNVFAHSPADISSLPPTPVRVSPATHKSSSFRTAPLPPSRARADRAGAWKFLPEAHPKFPGNGKRRAAPAAAGSGCATVFDRRSTHKSGSSPWRHAQHAEVSELPSIPHLSFARQSVCLLAS